MAMTRIQFQAGLMVSVPPLRVQEVRVDPWQEPQAQSMPELPSSGHPHGLNHPGATDW